MNARWSAGIQIGLTITICITILTIIIWMASIDIKAEPEVIKEVTIGQRSSEQLGGNQSPKDKTKIAQPHRPTTPTGYKTGRITMKERAVQLKNILERISNRRGNPTPDPEAMNEEELREEAKTYIGKSLREILPLFLECYMNALSNNPSLEGQLRLKFGVVGDQEYGALVDSSQVLKQDLSVADESLSECVRESIYALRFDTSPITDRRILVDYPFRFIQQQDDQHELAKQPANSEPAIITFEQVE